MGLSILLSLSHTSVKGCLFPSNGAFAKYIFGTFCKFVEGKPSAGCRDIKVSVRTKACAKTAKEKPSVQLQKVRTGEMTIKEAVMKIKDKEKKEKCAEMAPISLRDGYTQALEHERTADA